jgi:hypothetical protein
VTITQPGQSASLTFIGTTGEYLNLMVDAAYQTTVSVTVYYPSGALFSSFTVPGNYMMKYPFFRAMQTSGFYTVTLTPANGGTGTYVLSLSTAQLGTTSLNGESVPFTITRIGEDARVSFIAGAGQLINVGLARSSGSLSADMALITQYDTTLYNVSLSAGSGQDMDTPPLPMNGFYTIRINPWPFVYSSFSTFTVTVSTPLTGVLALDGPSQTVTVTRLGQDARLTFSANAGQLVNIGVGGAGASADVT